MAADRAALIATLGATGLVLGVALWLVHRPILAFDEGIWGPDQAWSQPDFLGGWWLFWAASTREGAEIWLSRQGWPDPAQSLRALFPNPFDAWLLGPLIARAGATRGWNLLQLAHHLANLAATVWLCRAAGVGWRASATAGALVAATPVMLFEIAGGRTLTGAVWPGLLALVALQKDRGALAGLLIGLQGLCYLYAGILVGILALLLRPRRGLLLALVVVAPYLLWLWPVAGDLGHRHPPDGYTSLPLAALVGGADLPAFWSFSPLLLLGLLGPAFTPGRRRWALVAGLALLVALGPTWSWQRHGDGLSSPLAWAMWAFPPLNRMHHPVRALLFAAPLLGVGLAIGLERLPKAAQLAPLLFALLGQAGMEQATAWGQGARPPGAELAEQGPEGAGAVLDLTGLDGPALALQPLHGHAIVGGLVAARACPECRSSALAEGVAGWRAGVRQPGFVETLVGLGVTRVLLVDRGEELDLRAFILDTGCPPTPGWCTLAVPAPGPEKR